MQKLLMRENKNYSYLFFCGANTVESIELRFHVAGVSSNRCYLGELYPQSRIHVAKSIIYHLFATFE